MRRSMGRFHVGQQLTAATRPRTRIMLSFAALLVTLATHARCSPIDFQVGGEVVANITLPDWAVARPHQTHEVLVGRDDLARFQPFSVQADIGDIVRFTFVAGNHTVTESGLDDPCAARGAFGTPFDRSNSSSSMSILVDTTNPRWFFCRQLQSFSHCAAGMLFAINPGGLWGDFVAKATVETPLDVTVPSGAVPPSPANSSSPSAAYSNATLQGTTDAMPRDTMTTTVRWTRMSTVPIATSYSTVTFPPAWTVTTYVGPTLGAAGT